MRRLPDEESAISVPGLAPVWFFDEVTSTMDVAREMAKEFVEYDLPLQCGAVAAKHQTSARGRQGRVWTMTESSAAVTYVVAVRSQIDQLVGFPLVFGCCVVRALEHLGAPIGLKWPNDLVAKSNSAIRKMGGILVEADIKDGKTTELLIGLGFNLRRSPSQPAEASDIETECARLLTATSVIAAVGKELLSIAQLIAKGSVVWRDFAEEWNTYCVHDGCLMSIEIGDGTIVTGRSCGVDPASGALRINCGDEIRFIVSGHVLNISFDRP